MSGNFLTGLEQLIWDEKNEADLVSLRKPQPEKDVFSAWFTGTFLDYFHRCLGQYIKVHTMSLYISRRFNMNLCPADNPAETHTN